MERLVNVFEGIFGRKIAQRGARLDEVAEVVGRKLLMLAQVSVPLGADVEDIRSGLERVGEQFGMVVALQHENIFRATSDVRPVMGLEDILESWE